MKPPSYSTALRDSAIDALTAWRFLMPSAGDVIEAFCHLLWELIKFVIVLSGPFLVVLAPLDAYLRVLRHRRLAEHAAYHWSNHPQDAAEKAIDEIIKGWKQ